MKGLAGLDYFLLVAYFAGVAGIGYFSGRRSRDSSRSYFLAGGTMGWMAIGASLFASNISAEHFIGLAADGAKSGLAVGQYEWIACLILMLLGWLFVPFYLRTGVFTMPEFLETRYNRHCRTYLSVVSLIAYVFTKISVSLYAGALVLNVLLGWNIWASAVVLLVATGAYTMFGGLRAVIYTDLFQAFILIGGGVFLTITAVAKAGGLTAVADSVAPDFFNLWKSTEHSEFPWTGILFGAPILGVWYWCTDQVIVQRTLAARGLDQARRATVFAGFLKILPVFILVLPGIAGRVLFAGEVDIENDANAMYPTMVSHLLPAGVKGLVVAALMAALMSSLSSVFNSSSTLVVMDFYKRWKPGASERELVRAGQIAVVVLVVAGLAWLPMVGRFGQLFQYLQNVQALISPPIAAVFLVGLLWKRANGAGALAALLVGFVVGTIRFVAELGIKADPAWVTWPLLVEFASIQFLHLALYLFLLSVAVLVTVSVATERPTQRQMAIFVERADADARTTENPRSRRVNMVLTILLAAIVLTLWACFSPWLFGGAG